MRHSRAWDIVSHTFETKDARDRRRGLYGPRVALGRPGSTGWLLASGQFAVREGAASIDLSVGAGRPSEWQFLLNGSAGNARGPRRLPKHAVRWCADFATHVTRASADPDRNVRVPARRHPICRRLGPFLIAPRTPFSTVARAPHPSFAHLGSPADRKTSRVYRVQRGRLRSTASARSWAYMNCAKTR